MIMLDHLHWINGGRRPTILFTDHKNLLALFSDRARPLACTKPNRDRLTRWGLGLMGVRYVIRHIDGEENRLADLGSRWGNQFAGERRDAATRASGPDGESPKAAVAPVESTSTKGCTLLRRLTKGLRGGPCPLLSRMLQRQPKVEPGADPVRKAVLRSAPPAVSPKPKGPDLDLPDGLVLPAPTHLVHRQRIVDSQHQHRKQRPEGLRPSAEQPTLWENADGQAWVPAEDEALKRCLYAVAHQGVSGHRGLKVTLEILQRRFFWAGMERDVASYRKGCLQCLKLAEGDMIPRPMGSQLIAERPGEVLMADFIKLGTSRSGYPYVLMLVDKFSRLVEFVPCKAATSVVAARAIVRWAAQRGLPQWLLSDGGPHFANGLLRELVEVLGLQHHITLPYCPWVNGSVEVVGKDLVWTLRALCSEMEAAVDEWDFVLPVAEYAINHRRRDILGGRSAIEVMIGQTPRSAVDLIIHSGPNLKEAREFRASAVRVDEYCAGLAESLERLHEGVRDDNERRRRRQALREASKGYPFEFSVGDYVMVTAHGNQVHPNQAPSQANREMARSLRSAGKDQRLPGRIPRAHGGD